MKLSVSFFKLSNKYIKVRKSGIIHKALLSITRVYAWDCTPLHTSACLLVLRGVRNELSSFHVGIRNLFWQWFIERERSKSFFLTCLPGAKEEGFMAFLFLCVNHQSRRAWEECFSYAVKEANTFIHTLPHTPFKI